MIIDADITARPIINVTLNTNESDILDMLTTMSQHHYDGVCRQASERGGFLYGWNNLRQQAKVLRQQTFDINGTFREFDTTCKICEHPWPLFGDDRNAPSYVSIRQWVKNVHMLLTAANECATSWIKQIDEDFLK